MKILLTEEDKKKRADDFGNRLMTGHTPFFTLFHLIMGNNLFRIFFVILIPTMLIITVVISIGENIYYKDLGQKLYSSKTIRSNYPNIKAGDIRKMGFEINSKEILYTFTIRNENYYDTLLVYPDKPEDTDYFIYKINNGDTTALSVR